MFSNEECAKFIKQAFDQKEGTETNSMIIDKLFSECLKEKPDTGVKGTDNMTAIIVKIKEAKDDTPYAQKKFFKPGPVKEEKSDDKIEKDGKPDDSKDN